jgi:hypothetical protein
MSLNTDFVIVYGALRSGTTLLRLMINNHPDLSCPGESDYLFDYMSRDQNGEWVLDREGLQRDRIFQASDTTCSHTLGPKETIDDLIAQLQAQGGGASRLVLMTHRALDVALDLYGAVPVIHILRDPRDVARSSIGMGWAGDVYHGAHHWIDTENGWKAVQPALDPKQHIELRYETLIRETQPELERILTFLGTSFDPAMMRYDQDSTYSAPDISLIEQWRRKQSPYQVGLVERSVGHLLEETGYQPSGHPLPKLGFVEFTKLRTVNKIAVWRERIRRFGFWDSFLVYLAYRLSMPRIGYGAQERINVKTEAYLK